MKAQAKAIRFRGENRGWSLFSNYRDVPATWQWVKGGKFQPLPEKA